MDEDPSALHFNVIDINDLIERYNTHKQWTEDTSTMANNDMPKSFTKKMDWMDWKAIIVNSLKSQPGRNGVPLNYFVGDNQGTVIRTNTNFLDDYVNRAPFPRRAFSSNASKFHSHLFRLISEKYVSEQKILTYKDSSDGRVKFMSLKEYYGGVGANAKSILTA